MAATPAENEGDDAETIDEMQEFYAPATGILFHIDAHRRTTAKMLEARYESHLLEFEATSWGRKEVAVLAANEEAAEVVREDIPNEEIVAERRMSNR